MFIDTNFPPPAIDRVALMLRAAQILDSNETQRMIEALIDRLDALAPDPDLEPNGDDELAGDDQGDVAWIENGEDRAVVMHTLGHEDAEPENVVLLHEYRNRVRRTRCEHHPRRRIEWPLTGGGERRPERMGFDK